jgi:N-acetylglucosamine-6-phosphate deacetylase
MSADVKETTGLFDLQVNGFAGIDFNDARLTSAALDHALEAMLATGVTQCLPTVITASQAQLMERFAALDAAVAASRFGPLMVPGYHLEGPFLNPAPGFRGCHPADKMTAPAIALIDKLQASLRKPILLVTIAPELPGAEDFVRAARARGIAVAMGHSDARAATVAAAATAGLTLSTHLGNGVAHQQHKFDNPLMAQLAEDALSACFIADGIHVPPQALRVMLRAKSIARSILVTDAVAAAGVGPGLYPFAGMTIERSADGAVREPGTPHLAGSSLTLDQAIRNVVTWGLGTFVDAVVMAATNPRSAIANAALQRRVSLDAGRVAWTPDHRVASTVIAGKILFAAPLPRH